MSTPFKVIVIGDPHVGKTTLTYRFCEGKFLNVPNMTIGVDLRTKDLNIDGEEVRLHLWDTAGLEKYRRSMVSHFYRDVDAVIFVYDVTSRKTFESLKHWINECEENGLHNSETIKVLVGNKCDEEIVVKTNEAQMFADKYNMPLFETSAKLDSEFNNLEGIFLTIAHKLVSKKPLHTAGNSSIKFDAIEAPPNSGWSCC